MSAELSEIYGQVMDDRHESDYELFSAVSKEDAEIDLYQAQRFVEAIEAWLQKEGWR